MKEFSFCLRVMKVYHHQRSHICKVVHRTNVLALTMKKIFRGQESGLGGVETYPWWGPHASTKVWTVRLQFGW